MGDEHSRLQNGPGFNCGYSLESTQLKVGPLVIEGVVKRQHAGTAQAGSVVFTWTITTICVVFAD